MVHSLFLLLRRARFLFIPVMIALALSGLLMWVATWRVNWGSPGFPAWLEALSTLAAFGAAGVAVYFAMQTQRLETKRDDGARRNSPGVLIEFPHPGLVSL